MSRHARPKTSKKPRPQTKPKRSKEPDTVQQPAPESKRTSNTARKMGHSNLDPELVIYEEAVQLFNAGRFSAAKEKFVELISSRNRDLAHSAESRIRMCKQRLAPT
jgi:hypothetical protein